MKLDILFLIFIGFFIKLTQSDGHGGKHVHVKILVPIPIHNHKHTHTIIKKPKEEKKIVIHKHHHHHGHDHGHKHGHKHKHDHGHNHKHGHHHKHGHRHGHKHNHDHHHHHQQHKGGHFGHHYKVDENHDNWNKHSNLENFDNKKNFKPSLPYEIDSYGLVPSFNEIDSGPNPENIDDDDDYYNSHKSLRSESFHITEAKNSQTNDPVGKHYISGNYKIHETDPIEQIHTRYGKIFQAPLANINVHESSYGPPPSGNGNESENVYNDNDEYDYDDEGEDQSENYNYDETIDKMQTNEAPKYNSLYGVEPLKQFFLNKIQ